MVDLHHSDDDAWVDLGPEISPAPQKPVVGNKRKAQRTCPQMSKNQPKPKTQKRKLPSASAELELPSDDDGLVLDLPGRAPVVKDTEHQVCDCEDSSLKAAASRVASVVDNKYIDLLDILKGQVPCAVEMRCHLWEIFSVPRCTPRVRELGGRARRSYDIKHYWDLSAESFQRTTMQDVLLLKPLCLFMSPPCTMVCSMQHSNWRRIKHKDKFMCLKEALDFIDFCAWLALLQLTMGLFFALEHPEKSLAWDRASVPLMQQGCPFFFLSYSDYSGSYIATVGI